MTVSSHAIIIGGGIGGLSTAIRLRRRGWQVTLYEKNAQVGGKMSQITHAGYRWDTGPSVITMRHVFEELFAFAGATLEDYLTLLPLNPLTRYFYADGTRLDASAVLAEMATAIERLEPRDVEGYLAYLAYAARIHRITGDVFIYNQPPTLRSFARVPVHEWLKADPLRTMQAAIESYVRSPYLRQLLGRFATYVGGSPYLAPATLNVIAHVELTGGVWYPKGGIYRIATALQKLAENLGVTIHVNHPITRIVTRNGKAIGIVDHNEQFVAANAVVSNLDVANTVNTLLDSEAMPTRLRRRLSDYAPSCSGFIMLLGIEGQSSQLAHHNIFFSADYKREFDAIFHTLTPAQQPTLYACITCKTDPEHASTNHENWFLMANAPALSPQVDWQTYRQTYRELVLAQLKRYGIDLTPRIRAEIVLTPQELAEMSGAWRGALYGASANSKWTTFRRPHNRSSIKGLYFVGGTTHPGGGVPMVMLSAKVTADLVCRDMPG